jgi:hypothetical protein
MILKNLSGKIRIVENFLNLITSTKILQLLKDSRLSPSPIFGTRKERHKSPKPKCHSTQVESALPFVP